jgi:hypothetical protein
MVHFVLTSEVKGCPVVVKVFQKILSEIYFGKCVVFSLAVEGKLSFRPQTLMAEKYLSHIYYNQKVPQALVS